MARRAEFLVYVVGVMLLGLSYYLLKHALSGPVLFAGVPTLIIRCVLAHPREPFIV